MVPGTLLALPEPQFFSAMIPCAPAAEVGKLYRSGYKWKLHISKVLVYLPRGQFRSRQETPKKLQMQIYASTWGLGARCVWAPNNLALNTCAGGALRLQVPSTVQIDFFDVIFRNNTAQSSRDIWADMSQSTTINVHLICITDLDPEACDSWCVRAKLDLASI